MFYKYKFEVNGTTLFNFYKKSTIVAYGQFLTRVIEKNDNNIIIILKFNIFNGKLVGNYYFSPVKGKFEYIKKD